MPDMDYEVWEAIFHLFHLVWFIFGLFVLQQIILNKFNNNNNNYNDYNNDTVDQSYTVPFWLTTRCSRLKWYPFPSIIYL